MRAFSTAVTPLRFPATLLAALALALLAGGCTDGMGGGGERVSAVKGVTKKPIVNTKDAAEAVRLVNEERAKRGLRKLVRRADLDAVAAAHARDLMGMNKLSHISSDGRQLENRLARLEWEWAGENLARNKGYESSAREAVKGWIASPRHYENMFRADFSQTGMAALTDPDSGFTYFVQIFIIPVE